MRRKKQGRNTPCWCGSGKKFKFCHLNRERQESVKPWEAEKDFRKAFTSKKCLVPKEWQDACSNKIAKAHTVPKSSSLKAIARSGHVYGFVPSLENIRKNKGVLVPELVGINRASTFTGFCTTHDDKIFSSLEKRRFCGDSEQMFALAYRSFCREMYTKLAAAETSTIWPELDKGRSVDDQEQIQMMSFLYGNGVNAGVQDNIYYKGLFDSKLKSANYSGVNGLVFYLEQPPPVMCSGSFFPEQDFTGKNLQDISDLTKTPELISVTSFYDGEKGILAFAWLEESEEICATFTNSLLGLGKENLASAFIRLAFEHFENTFIEPGWWENLNDNQRTRLIYRMSASANPILDRQESTLTDDGVHFQPWKIVETQIVGATNVAL